MDQLPDITRKQELLRGAARGIKGLSLRLHGATASALEGVLARGDRSLGPAIERAFRSGARFDSWDDQLKLDAWHEAFAFCEIDTERYLGTIPVTARLPWDHFDIGLEDGFLAREYRKALQSRLSPPCGKVAGMFIHHTNVSDAATDTRRLVCYDCGVACDMSKMRQQRIGFLTDMGALVPLRREASQPRPVPDPTDPGPSPHPIPDPVSPPAARRESAGTVSPALWQDGAVRPARAFGPDS